MPILRTRGPFGRIGDGRGNACPLCDNCCGVNFEDMPEVIYVRLVLAGLYAFDIYTPLYRILAEIESCTCGSNRYTHVRYESPLFRLINEDDPANETDSASCCGSIQLEGACTETGSCDWYLDYCNPVNAERGPGNDPCERHTLVTDAATGDRITCSSFSGFALDSQYHEGNPCLNHSGFGFVVVYLYISTSIPGGTLASPCAKLCCGMPLEWFLTINVPEIIVEGESIQPCSKLDGAVVTLTFDEAEGLFFYDGIPPNPGGSHTLTWRGWLTQCVCCPIRVTLLGNTWTDESTGQAQCNWQLLIGTPLDLCFSEQVSSNSGAFCPTSFSGTLYGDGQCGICCDGEDVAIEIEIDL